MAREKVDTFGTVERDGIYVCGSCGDNEAVLRRGEDAPTCCCNGQRSVTWFYQRPLASRRIGFVIQS